MKNFIKKVCLSFFVLFLPVLVFCQITTFIHKVNEGENLYRIAKKYKTTVEALISINPDAVNGIDMNQKIYIPISSNKERQRKKEKEKQKNIESYTKNKGTQLKRSLRTMDFTKVPLPIHSVKSKETIYSICKKYNMSQDRLLNLNPELRSTSLKVGQKIKVVNLINKALRKTDTLVNKVTKAVQTNASKTTNYSSELHEVKPNETLYSIAKKHRITVSELIDLNIGLTNNNIKVGQLINIPICVKYAKRLNYKHNQKVNNPTINNTPVTKDNLNKIISNIPKRQSDAFKFINVKPLQTLYSIEKEYGVTYGELLEWNPILKDGLKSGMILKVKDKVNNNYNEQNKNTNTLDLNKYFNQQNNKVDIAVLMPFNLNKNNPYNPNLKSTFTKDMFLNVITDFYSGVTLAVENFKSLSNISVEVINTKETKSNINLKDFHKKLVDKDIILGPFFQKNIDKLSQKLKGTSTLLFSPLSIETSKEFNNLVRTMPSKNVMVKEMFDYLHKQNENVLLLGDFEDLNTKIPEYFYNIPPYNDISKENIEILLDKVNKNYIVVDLNHKNIRVTTGILHQLSKKYNINLVILDKNKSADKYASIKVLADLKLTYPSVTNNESSSISKNDFKNLYKSKFNKSPNKFAIRGYDIMYDILNRSVNSTNIESFFSNESEEIENKFNYSITPDGIINNGAYILQYTPEGKIIRLK